MLTKPIFTYSVIFLWVMQMGFWSFFMLCQLLFYWNNQFEFYFCAFGLFLNFWVGYKIEFVHVTGPGFMIFGNLLGLYMFVLVMLLFGLLLFVANLWTKTLVVIILRNSNQRKWKLKYQGRIALLQELTLELAMQQLRVLHSGFDLSPVLVFRILFFSL